MKPSTSKPIESTPSRKRVPSSTPLLADDIRHAMIEEAAYFRAASRGFDGGDPVEDWLWAEQDIEDQLMQRH